MENVGERIRFLRGKMSQTEFGEFVDIPQRKLSRLETGAAPIDLDSTQKICKAMAVRSDWLLFGLEPVYRDEGTRPDPPQNESERLKDLKIKQLERQLSRAKDDALKAYKLVVSTMPPATAKLQEKAELGLSISSLSSQTPNQERQK